jgi:hypothetical protein
VKAGSKLALYLSESVAEDLALIAKRFPGQSAPALVRLSLSRLANQAREELERDAACETARKEVADGRTWN